MSTPYDLTGERFGRLTVVTFYGHRGQKRVYLCKCDCGNESIAYTQDLRSGRHKSCGCLQKEAVTTHGHTIGQLQGVRSSPEYATWQAIKSRCTAPKNTHYQKYGGRGIKMCKRWLNSFETFFSDMGSKPTPQHTIDRIDGDGNYELSNCRWATRKEQAQNRKYTPPSSPNPRDPKTGKYTRPT